MNVRKPTPSPVYMIETSAGRNRDIDRNKIAVCMLVTNIDSPSGGVQKNSWSLLSELNRRGINTFVVARNYHSLPRIERVGGTLVRRSPIVGKWMGLNGFIYLVDGLFWVLRNRNRFDVVHCQQMFGSTMIATLMSFIVRKPIVTRVTTVGELGEVGHIRQMPFSRIRLMLIRRVTRWIALTEEMKAELLTLDIPEERITIIHNSTDIPAAEAFDVQNRAKLREKLSLGDQKIGLYVGRLSEEKNLDVLIDAWVKVNERYPDALLLLLGAGGEFRNVESQLKKQVERLGLEDNVRFLGHVSNTKEYLLASDIFVLATRTEGMSNALVEAFACGATIIATDIPANREICVHRENALLVPPGDAGALGNAVLEALDCPELAERLGRAAREKAERELSVDTMVSNYLDTYRDAVSETVI